MDGQYERRIPFGADGWDLTPRHRRLTRGRRYRQKKKAYRRLFRRLVREDMCRLHQACVFARVDV